MYVFRLVFRRLWRERTTSLLHLTGLATGMTACFLIGLFARYEWSYDRQSPHAPFIWRAFNISASENGTPVADANTHALLGPSLAADLPEVTAFTRLFNHGETEVTLVKNNSPYAVPGVWMCDTGFLRMFPQRFITGDPSTCLIEPFSLLLAKSTAHRLFPEGNAAGQSLRVPGGAFAGLYTVKAVIADPPPNTHLKMNAIASYETRHALGHTDNWDDYWEYTYFQLRPGADTVKVRAQLAAYSTQFLQKQGIRLDMQQLEDIHLYSNLTYEIEPNGKARTVYFLSVIGAFILLLALINYVNLTTAQAIKRSAEVGVRKMIGAAKGALIGRFLLEGIVLCTGAVLLALLLTDAVLPWFVRLTGRPLSDLPGTGWFLIQMGLGMLLVASLFGAWYPAWYLSSFKPALTVRSKGLSPVAKGGGLRKSLIVFQFACAVALLTGIVIIGRQMQFLQQHDKGLSLDQVVAVKMPGFDWRQDSLHRRRLAAFQQEIRQISGIVSMTASSVAPSLGVSTISGSSSGMYWVKKPDQVFRTAFYGYDVENSFYPTYGIRFLAGGPFDARDARSGNQNIVINATAARTFGFADPAAAIGEEISYTSNPNYRMKIHGVVADFHIESLKSPARPTFYYSTPEVTSGYFSLLVDARQTQKVLSSLREQWLHFYPEDPLVYWFLQERFALEYQSERQLSRIFGLFAVLAVVIACLGLFGLAAFTAEQRTKEIGVRKVLGASITSVIMLLAKDFLQLVVAGILVATPIAWYFMDHWLSGFAYRITVPWWAFLPAGALALFVACLTVGIQSVRVALANPVDALRSE